MRQFAVTSVLLIVVHSVFSEANVQIKPIAIDNKSNSKNDLKPEEARYRDPIIPEYYQGNRQGFVTSNIMDNYGAYDRYGYNNNYDNKFGSTFFDKFGMNKYGIDYNNHRERFGSNYGVNTSPLDSKFGSFGKPYPPMPAEGGAIFGPYGYPTGGILPPELEKKASVVLPLAGAALLGIATYALVTGGGIAAGPVIGKRRKRSVFDEKVEQHLAYRAQKKSHKNTQ